MKDLKRKTDLITQSVGVNEDAFKSMNFRSQETMYTWLGINDFGPHQEKKMRLVAKYLKSIKARA